RRIISTQFLVAACSIANFFAVRAAVSATISFQRRKSRPRTIGGWHSHQIGAEKQKRGRKLFRGRDQSELPALVETIVSTTRIYPSQSGQNRQEVRTSCTIQLSGQQGGTDSSPN